VRNRIRPGAFPTLSAVFGAPFMAEVARAIYGQVEVVLNHQVYVNLNHGTPEPIRQLPFVPHFDKIQTLKFFVYLTDTSARTGAMGVVPGSHLANREERLACYEENPDFRAVRNLVSGEELLPVEAPAGTLFVFDTDVTHEAGHVAIGEERRIMRGHTRSLEQLRSLRLEAEGSGVTLGTAA
jgi:ectoine hydroxylase-related dioxygenase (phytanoyl-CoA dioxygenase family)